VYRGRPAKLTPDPQKASGTRNANEKREEERLSGMAERNISKSKQRSTRLRVMLSPRNCLPPVTRLQQLDARVTSVDAQVSGVSFSNTVGRSSLTVGWIRTWR
jgi:hypothetical protein